MNMPALAALLGAQSFVPPAGTDKVNLLLLHAFHAVAAERNFAHAAVALRMSQPTLVRQVRELEDLISVPLVIRRQNAVLLTPAGEKLARELQQLFAQVRQSIAQVCDVDQLVSGCVNLGLSAAALTSTLPAQLSAAAATKPGLQFHYQELSPQAQIDALLSRELDAGFWYLSGDTAPRRLSHQLIQREPLCLALPADHALTAQPAVSLKQLAQLDMIHYETGEAFNNGFLNTVCLAHGFIPRVAHIVQSPLSALTLIGQGLGLALLPNGYRQVSMPGVAMRPLQETVNLQLHMVWDSHPAGTAAARWLSALLAD
ncbi:LysR substrate-binding domain-containing protein [Silvimonas amylolytica]|uniref:LysR family transcriptional regulator n=1 Tax=Silvimonas amylolytica TaxID=449663 RepID=A0ABQ2PPS2_9NEIS|nr:LysR substrate-binding domain-containing protein [Silvimonas amylolytica]GGP27415.1 LysR family transcriptional regulator [Silvimonas amylolytica]